MQGEEGLKGAPPPPPGSDSSRGMPGGFPGFAGFGGVPQGATFTNFGPGGMRFGGSNTGFNFKPSAADDIFRQFFSSFGGGGFGDDENFGGIGGFGGGRPRYVAQSSNVNLTHEQCQKRTSVCPAPASVNAGGSLFG
jgi:DnaJ family protein B protein 4